MEGCPATINRRPSSGHAPSDRVNGAQRVSFQSIVEVNKTRPSFLTWDVPDECLSSLSSGFIDFSHLVVWFEELYRIFVAATLLQEKTPDDEIGGDRAAHFQLLISVRHSCPLIKNMSDTS